VTGGQLDYHLGDVSDGVTQGTGDNLVSTSDVSLLGAHYGITLALNGPFNYLDVGPTTTSYVDGRPTTDNLVNFEDLVMFAINFNQVSGPARPAAMSGSMPSSDGLVLESPDQVALNTTLAAELHAQGAGTVQAMSIRPSWARSTRPSSARDRRCGVRASSPPCRSRPSRTAIRGSGSRRSTRAIPATGDSP
jgi:hypothetical protein